MAHDISSPGRNRAEHERDGHEEQYRTVLKQRGGAPLGRAKEYDFAADPVVPLADPRHVHRGESRVDAHRRQNSTTDRPVREKAPFGRLRSEKA